MKQTRYRVALSALRTAVKNRAQAVLHRHGILHDFSDLFGKAGRRFLNDLALPEGSRQALTGCLQLLDNLTLLIDEVEQWMVENLEEDDFVRLLMTIPGVGLILAHVLRAEIGEIQHKLIRRRAGSQNDAKKAHPAKRDRPINSWILGDARVAPLRCPILRLRQNHCNHQKHVNHPLTSESVSGIGWGERSAVPPLKAVMLKDNLRLVGLRCVGPTL